MQPTRKHPSAAYLAALERAKKFHQENKAFSGQRTWKNFSTVKRILGEYPCTTLLDYGAGKGLQYTQVHIPDPDGKLQTVAEAWGVELVGYDPAWPPLIVLPDGVFDGVLCIDVLEYIPLSDLPWVLDLIFSKAEKFVFVRCSCAPGKKQWGDAESAAHGRSLRTWLKFFVGTALAHPGVDWFAKIKEPAQSARIWRRASTERGYRLAWE